MAGGWLAGWLAREREKESGKEEEGDKGRKSDGEWQDFTCGKAFTNKEGVARGRVLKMCSLSVIQSVRSHGHFKLTGAEGKYERRRTGEERKEVIL